MPTLNEQFVNYWNEHYPSDASARQSAKDAGFKSVEEAQSHVYEIFRAGAAAGAREERKAIVQLINDIVRDPRVPARLRGVAATEINRRIRQRGEEAEHA